MGIILVLESEVANVLPGEYPCIYHQISMDTGTTTLCNNTKAPCTTKTPCNITEDPSTEEYEGYTQFLQTYEVELNNIMNPNNDDNNESIGQAKEGDENLVQENPSLHIKTNENDAYLKTTQCPWSINIINTNWWDQYY